MTYDDLNTSEGAREDFAALIDAFMPLAKGLLRRDGSFVPFAGYLDGAGEAQGLQVQLDDDEQPAPNEVVDALEGALRERAAGEGVRAAVIFADIRLRSRGEPEAEAILGRFEHCDGSAFRLFLRYATAGEGVVEFHDPSGAPEDPAGLTSRRH